MFVPLHGAADLSGLPHHDGSQIYVSNATPKIGETVVLRIRVPHSYGAQGVKLRIVIDEEPRIFFISKKEEDNFDAWYEVGIQPRNLITNYRFMIIKDRSYSWLNAAGLFDYDVSDKHDFKVSMHAPAPQWASETVVYQIFPDRFNRSGTSKLAAPQWAIVAQWDDEPFAYGRETGKQFFGGDLLGIEQKIDYLKDLGVETVYLTPIFEAGSAHRYDAYSFDRIDAHLGGDKALVSLISALHANDLKFIGDITTNHTGIGHSWFKTAKDNPEAIEYNYYHWTDEAPGYESWLGHSSLPKLNYASKELEARMIAGPQSVIGKWLQAPFNYDGWRVDVANMTGRYKDLDVNQQVAQKIRKTMADINPEALLVSEHFHDSTKDLQGDGWQANMNYSAFSRPVWSWLLDSAKDFHMLGQPPQMRPRTAGQMITAMNDFNAQIPWKVQATQWNMLGSHDTPRIRSIVSDRNGQLTAAGLLFTFPGTPVIFAGDEWGATGSTGEHARVTMPWDRSEKWDSDLWSYYHALIQLRRSHPALISGGLRWLALNDDGVIFARESRQATLIVFVSRTFDNQIEISKQNLNLGNANRIFGNGNLDQGASVYKFTTHEPGVSIWEDAS